MLDVYGNIIKNGSWVKISMKTDLISVVIPVYNVEKYLERCLDSILNQSYSNLQIIIVDDGSTDTSGKICDRYAMKDSRIQVFHKENGGLSDARNFGLEHICGKYVSFIDSDDYVSKDYIKYLYGLIETVDADISACKHLESNKENYEFELTKPCGICIYSREEALERLCYQKGVTTSAWAKLYKTQLFKSIRFPNGKLYEDESTFYKLLENSEKMVCGGQIHYLYFYRSDGIVRSQFNKRKMDYVQQSLEFSIYIKHNYPQLYNGAISKLLWSCLHLWVQIDSSKENPKEYSELKNLICKYRIRVILDRKVRMRNKILLVGTFGGHITLRKIYMISKKR